MAYREKERRCRRQEDKSMFLKKISYLNNTLLLIVLYCLET